MKAKFGGLILIALASAACGRPFKVKTAPGFVELEHQDAQSNYAYRATTPDGVVVGVRVVDDEERGDLDFWAHAVTLHLREGEGYALVDASDVASADGTRGKRLRFARDEGGKPYAYWVSLFMAQGRVYVVEAGGTLDQMAKSEASIDWMTKTLKLRCGSIVAPVLASRTCHRW